MPRRKISAIIALTLVLALLMMGARSFAASSPARVSLDLKNAELAEVFRVLATIGEANIVVSPAVAGKVTVKLNNVPLEEALDIICSVSELEYVYMDGTIMVTLKGTLSKLMQEAVVEKLEVLNISPSDAAIKLSFAVPGVAVQPDDKTGTLLIRGTQADILLAKSFLSKVDVPVPASKAVVAEEEVIDIIQLSNAEAEGVYTAVSKLLKATLAVDTRLNAILAGGKASDVKAARGIIEKLDIQKKAETVAEPVEIRVLQLANASAADVKAVAALIVPAERVQADAKSNSLIIKATPEEHAKISDLVKNIEAATPKAQAAAAVKENLEVITLMYAKAADVAKAIGVVVPSSKVAIDERTNKVIILADAATAAEATALVKELDVKVAEPVVVTPVAPALRMGYYGPKYAKATDVEAVAKLAAPGAKIQVIESNNSIVAYGTDAEHAIIEEALKKLDQEAALLVKPVEVVEVPVESLVTVQINYANAKDVKTALDAVLGSGKVSVDERTNQVLMMVTPAGNDLAMSIIKSLDIDIPVVEEPPVAAPIVEVYQVKYALASGIRNALLAVLPESNVSVDDRTNKLMLKVTPEEKVMAMAIITELDVKVEAPEVAVAPLETLEIVQIKYAPASEVGKALSAVLAAGKVNVDDRTNKVIMKVTPTELAQAKAVIDSLDVPVAGTEKPVPELTQTGFYKLYNVKPSDIEASVKIVAGTAKVQASDETSSITVYGTTSELKSVESLISKLDVKAETAAGLAEATKETLEVVQLANASATDVRNALTVLMPPSKLAVNERTNKLMMVVTPSLKEQALTIIAALDVPVAKEEAVKAEPVKLGFYQLKFASAKDMEAPVKLVATNSRVQVAERTNSLIVYGAESELALVEQVIAKLDIQVAVPETAPVAEEVVVSYKLQNASPTDVSKALAIILPASSMMPDDRSGNLIVRATADLQKMAADVITTLDVKGITVALAEADAIVTRVYKLNYATPADIKAALSEVTAGKVSVDTRTSSLVVTAKISEQEQIVDIIDELDLELAQVFFEASLYELSNDASKRLGIDWTVNKLVFGYNTLSQLATVSLDFDNKISALADEGKAKLISKQHTFTVDGKEGRILIGDRIPVIVQKVEQSQVVNTVEYINAGIELSILPKVSYDGSITAQVKPTISSIVGWTPQNYPQIRTRELETIVTVKSGQSAIIGGLFSQDEIETITKVPILGDIPLLKELFTKRGTDVKDQEIIIVITAWTITPGQTTQLKDGIVEIKGPVL